MEMLTRCAYVCFLFVFILHNIIVVSSLPANKGCRCVPNQWTGLLKSVERQYDLRGGQTAVSENAMYVDYDYDNRMFLVEDVISGNVAISDFKKGYKYLIRGEHCHAIETSETMRKMCLPENADLRGEYLLGKDTPVEIWQFQGPMNVTLRTTVMKDNCMPIAEEVSMTTPDYASLTNSFYFNVEFDAGHKLTKPNNCMYSKVQDMKRGSQEHAALEDILQQFQHQ